jgi:hypothetical protein
MCPATFHSIVSLRKIRTRQQLYETGIVAATIINAAPRKKGAKVVQVEDLIPSLKRGSKKKRQSVEEMIAIAANITRAFGGKDLRGQKKLKQKEE